MDLNYLDMTLRAYDGARMTLYDFNRLMKHFNFQSYEDHGYSNYYKANTLIFSDQGEDITIYVR